MTSIAGTEVQATATWLTGVFNADTGPTGIVGLAPGGVWDGAATEGTEYPILRFDTQSDGVVVRGNSFTEIWLSTLWLIRGVTNDANFDALTPIAARIQALVHGVTSQAVPGGMIVECMREQAFRLETLQGGKEFRHLGGIYRINVQAT